MAAQTSTLRDLIGTWNLLAYELLPAGGGDVSYPLGSDAHGRITYGADGTMSAFLMEATRESLHWRGAAAPELKAAAYDSFMAYCGTYEMDGENVIHHLSMSSIPAWTGTDQARHVSFKDANLVLTLPLPNGGTYRLTWERYQSPDS